VVWRTDGQTFGGPKNIDWDCLNVGVEKGVIMHEWNRNGNSRDLLTLPCIVGDLCDVHCYYSKYCMLGGLKQKRNSKFFFLHNTLQNQKKKIMTNIYPFQPQYRSYYPYYIPQYYSNFYPRSFEKYYCEPRPFVTAMLGGSSTKLRKSKRGVIQKVRKSWWVLILAVLVALLLFSIA
jgi:hypothetical protein